MNPLSVMRTCCTMMTHALVKCIKHTCRGRMPLTACTRMARQIFLLTYHESTYPSVALAPLVVHAVSRVFSACGCLFAGRRNRLSKNMERQVLLNMNSKILSSV